MGKSILFAAAEGLPFIKSGGLADVIGSLPQRLNQQGYETRVVMPLYQKIIDGYISQMTKIATFDVMMGSTKTVASIWFMMKDGTTYYFVEHQGYFEREGMYGYPDDGERFAFFDLAVTDMLQHIGYYPDILHEHDWHTGMIPLLCKHRHPWEERYNRIRHVFTIHNLLFQGNFPPAMLESCLGLPMDLYYDGTLKFREDIDFMKAGILFADKITTVSNTYAQEIKTPEFGQGLDQVLQGRSNDLWGIVNGIDTKIWDPQTDGLIAKRFGAADLKNKRACKRALQEKLGLRAADDVLLIGMVSRLTWQKGIYLIIQHIYELMGLDIQFVVLGTGDNDAESQLKSIEYKFPHRAVYYCGYNEELSHAIYAGADAFLMPSLFEPCGISQLISLRYGTLPIVRETGGLKDTVEPYNQYTKEGTGFSFRNPSAEDMLNIIRYAADVYYYHPDDWRQLQANAMAADVSWDASCRIYEQLYNSL